MKNMTERIAPLRCTEKPTDTTGRFPSLLRQPKTTGRISPHAVLLPIASKPKMTGRISPPVVLPTDTMEKGLPSPLHQKPTQTNGEVSLPVASKPKTTGRISLPCRVPHRWTEKFPSPLCQSPHKYGRENFSPPPGCPETTDQGLPLSLATKTYIDERRGFPPPSRLACWWSFFLVFRISIKFE